jgi:hypothetical protein
VLAGLDAVDWSSLGSATGTATGLPGMLRALAAAEEPAAREAVGDLVNEVYHQQTIWPCTGPAIPFLAELAVHRVPHSDDLLWLLAQLSRDGLAGEVAPHVPGLTVLLDDPDPQNREATAFFLGWHDVAAEHAVPLLLARWKVESEPLVRASVLAAVGSLDPKAGRTLVGAALRDPEPALRAAAGVVLAWMREWWSKKEVPLPKGAIDTVAAAFSGTDPLRGWVWCDDALGVVLEGFADMRGAENRMVGLLLRSPSPGQRRQAVYDIEARNRRSRSAPAELVPLLLPLLKHPDDDTRATAVTAVRRSGSAAALAADGLARVAATLGDGGSDRAAETALATLVDLADARWPALLRAAWRHDRPLGTVAESLAAAEAAAGGATAARLPASPELIAAVTGRLGTIATVEAARKERDSLATLVCGWKGDAVAAAPALVSALDVEVARNRPRPFSLCTALGSLGPAALPALPSLRFATARSFHGTDRMRAGLAIWRLTGAAEPALTAAERLLDGPNGYDEDRDAWLYPTNVSQLAPLGADLAPLVPALRQHIARFPGRHAGNSAIARLLWHLHGDVDEVVPVLRAALSIAPRSPYDYSRHPPSEALLLTSELGPVARPLADLLRAALDSPVGWVRTHAADGLARMGELAPPDLVPHLVPDPEKCTGWLARNASQALDTIVDLDVVEAVPRLTGWLATDLRLNADADDAVRLDEAFQTRVRDFLGRIDG